MAELLPSPTEVIDHKARGEAALAHQRVDDHEATCAARWKQAHESIRELRRLIVGTLISAIGALAGIVYGLVTRL